ncbi:GNAT family N-acetyltransferase [Carnobacterium viridans]|uniref:N-acetyltransferase domain-containing protein n=1 Tax=Carnobacterium viridans TaxID=174587 RepID=A0A1H0Z060_9LACT|nr:GNAT family N-acetyltransferase [Carnobacterium viridans]UDE94861.1 GNAT family N-acetyltransferase [Carnobacterium viridans]SDQ20813.1 hypothetical protein SAMN04487752_1246 [Carnobacterium viridans]
MIYKCDESKREDVLNFLYQDPSVNLFAIGDIETYGVEHFDVDVWAYVNNKDDIIGVLVRYKENLMPIHGRDFEGFDTFLPLIQSLSPMYISGNEEVIAQYEEEFTEYEKEETFLAECKELEMESPLLQQVVPLDKEAIQSYIDFLKEMGMKHEQTIEEIANDLDLNKNGIQVIKDENGKIISSGRIAIETKLSGMILAVGTIESYRKQGYATAVVSALVSYCNRENKTACLFYSNPDAGRLYQHLGFKDTQKWIMLKNKEV